LAIEPSVAGESQYVVFFKEIAKKVKEAKSLTELVWCIGEPVKNWSIDKQRASRLCSDYLDSYQERHAQVKILGMAEPVPLASIYTEVRIVPPNSLRGYRTHDELHELFVKNRYSSTVDFADRHPPRRGIDAVNDPGLRFLSLLGAPGAGKSTFLRYVGLMALKRHEAPLASQGPGVAPNSGYRFNLLPVLLELRGLRKTPRDFGALVDAELRTFGFPPNFGRIALEAGALLVLLDGLDEVPAEKLQHAIQGIQSLVNQYDECRYITSCRTAFYKDYFGRFTDALLTDFTDEQIGNLIENWFRSERDRELGTASRLWNLLKASEHRATRELAKTPLLATFLCLVYDDRQQLPTNRAELYGEALRILLERWAASKRVHGEPVFPGLSTKREITMLETIAAPAYEREQYFFTAGELATSVEAFLGSDVDGPDKVDGRKVVEEIELKQGILVQRAHDKYSFSHLTLHEYLVASHYYKAGRSVEIANATLTDPRWREVHLLLAGLQEPDADTFLFGMLSATAERARSGPVKSLLSWANRIALADASPQQTAARRAVLLAFPFASALAQNLADARECASRVARISEASRTNFFALAGFLARARSFDLALELTREIARNLLCGRDTGRIPDSVHDIIEALDAARARERDRISDLDVFNNQSSSNATYADHGHPPNASELQVELEKALTREKARANTQHDVFDAVRARDLTHALMPRLVVARDRARDRALEIGCLIMQGGIIVAEKSSACAEAAKAVQRYLRNRVASPDGVLRKIEASVDLPVGELDFSESGAQECVEFFIGTRRVIECRDAAERVTRNGWNQILKRLIAPSSAE
jgi:hypothetical protein